MLVPPSGAPQPGARGPVPAIVRQRRRWLPALLLTALLAACGDAAVETSPAVAAQDPVPGGTLVVATPAEPGTLQPLYADASNSRQVADLLFERLADVGRDLNTVGDSGFTPSLARGWTWSADSLSIVFALDPAARWHDGRPVRANDVTFSFARYRDPQVASYVLANLARIDSVTAPDSLTATVWFAERYPEQFFDAVAHVYVLPEHLLRDVAPEALRAHEFSRSPIGSGPFRFGGWTAGQRVEIVAEERHHRGRPYLDRVIWTVAPDPTAAFGRVIAGEADVYEALRPEHLADIARTPDVRTLGGPGLAYAYLGLNALAPKSRGGTPHPLLADRELRRALSRGVDVTRAVRNVMDTLAVVPLGPMTRAFRQVDTTFARLTFDSAGARATLDSLGWRDADGDGVRERDGRPLAFTAIVPTSSAPRVRMLVLLQEQLRALGVRLEVEQLEYNAFIERLRTRDFDAYAGAALLDGTPAGLRQTWASAGAAENGGNYQSYRSAAFDAVLDSALAAGTPAARSAALGRAYGVLVQDAPAIWLYEPRTMLAVHARVVAPPARGDGWWRDLPAWFIPPDARLARDRAVVAAR